MKIAFILGSIVRAQPDAGAPGGHSTTSATAFERQLICEARALPGQDNIYGSLSSPIYSSSSVNGRHTIYWLYRHGLDQQPILPHRINYCANFYALHQLGVRAVFALNAMGSLDQSVPPGTHVVPDQLIDYTWGRRQTMFDIRSVPTDIFPAGHVDFTLPFSDRFRQAWLDSFDQAGLSAHDGGVCAVTQGPRLESKAEIARLASDGCHFVNMTLCPEAALARELKMDYLCSGFICNWAAGMNGASLIDVGQCERFARAGLTQLAQLIDLIHQEHQCFEVGLD
ncbi:MAG: MTAP family purine nucleoside phosphorylase [Proteobacteria bacterium]|nr:MTAP family purine nucleoside phosphorylase [Pseudomonadota bacterium]